MILLLLVPILGLSVWAPREGVAAAAVKPVPTIREGKAVAPPLASTTQSEPDRKILTVRRGESFFEILTRNGVSGAEALAVTKSARRCFDTRRVQPGHTLALEFSPENQRLTALDYQIASRQKLVVRMHNGRFTARRARGTVRLAAAPNKTQLMTASVIPLSDLPTPQVARKPHRAASTALGPSSKTPGLRQVDVTVRKGHSLSDILTEHGVRTSEIGAFTKSVRKVYNLGDIRPGKTMHVWLTPGKPTHIHYLAYEIDDTTYLEVRARKGTFHSQMRTLPVDVRYERAEGRIGSTLYTSARAGGIHPEIVMQLTDIFAWNINFFTDIQAGDTYSVLYEKRYVDEKFKGYGRVVAASFVNQGERHVAIYYANARRGIEGYYNEQGKPLKKMFLKAPLNYRRISSGFTHSRRHPIFHDLRPHLGVDYAAPTGTPVCALGPGRVELAGWQTGFGKTIRVRHPEGYKSYYGHLCRYAPGIRTGKKVDQGDVIGYVGSTGWATGPHLDFRVSQNGRFVNPLKLKSVNGPALSGRALANFKHVSGQRLAMLEDLNLDIALAVPEPVRTATEKRFGG